VRSWLRGRLLQLLPVRVDQREQQLLYDAAEVERKPDRDSTPKLDGHAEAHIVAFACSEPLEGRTRWTYALLADRLVPLEEMESNSTSEETIRQWLKNNLKPHRSEYWYIPAKEKVEFA